MKNAFIAPKGNNILTQMLLICFIVRESKDQYYNIQAICSILAVNGFSRVGKVNRYLRREEMSEIKGTKVLPITYEEVKKYSDNLFALLDALKEVKKNDNSKT